MMCLREHPGHKVHQHGEEACAQPRRVVEQFRIAREGVNASREARAWDPRLQDADTQI